MKRNKQCICALLTASFALCPLLGVQTSTASASTMTATQIRNILSDAEEKIDKLYDVDETAITQAIAETETKLDANDLTGATASAIEVLAMQAESRPVTARSVWHRPTETTLSALVETMDTYQEIGVNLVYLETFYHGYSMFQSEYVPYYPTFATAEYEGYDDYLDAFVTLANARGIETHAWVENFYVGINASTPLVAQNPSWLLRNDEVDLTGDDLTYLQRGETGYIFLDPANDGVQDFLVAYYNELLDKNPLVKGLNLDYIRYPVSTQSQDTGYTRMAMTEFATQIGKGDVINPFATTAEILEVFKSQVVNTSANYVKWTDYRRTQITDFVKRIRDEVKAGRDLVLSTAVFTSVNESYEKKKQDWQQWFSSGWIDVATPMAYLDTAMQVKNAVQTMKNLAGEKCYYYTGLASSYRGFPAEENVYQIEASYEAKANGYAIFCATQLLGMEDVQSLLKTGLNSQSAVLPHAETKTVVRAYFERILSRAERIYVPKGGMTETQKTSLTNLIQSLLTMPLDTAEQIATFSAGMSAISLSTYASGEAKLRIEETIADMQSVLDIQKSRKVENATIAPPTPPETSDDSGAQSSESAGDQSDWLPQRGCSAVIGTVNVLGVLTVVSVTLVRKKRR